MVSELLVWLDSIAQKGSDVEDVVLQLLLICARVQVVVHLSLLRPRSSILEPIVDVLLTNRAIDAHLIEQRSYFRLARRTEIRLEVSLKSGQLLCRRGPSAGTHGRSGHLRVHMQCTGTTSPATIRSHAVRGSHDSNGRRTDGSTANHITDGCSCSCSSRACRAIR